MRDDVVEELGHGGVDIEARRRRAVGLGEERPLFPLFPQKRDREVDLADVGVDGPRSSHAERGLGGVAARLVLRVEELSDRRGAAAKRRDLRRFEERLAKNQLVEHRDPLIAWKQRERTPDLDQAGEIPGDFVPRRGGRR